VPFLVEQAKGEDSCFLTFPKANYKNKRWQKTRGIRGNNQATHRNQAGDPSLATTNGGPWGRAGPTVAVRGLVSLWSVAVGGTRAGDTKPPTSRRVFLRWGGGSVKKGYGRRWGVVKGAAMENLQKKEGTATGPARRRNAPRPGKPGKC